MKHWGLLASIDMYDCNPATIRDAKAIRRFVVKLCQLIDMRRFGPCTVIHFGDEDRVSGFSMYQLIETSNISAHFANATNAVYLDIFSCKFFNADAAADFAKKFFDAKEVVIQVTQRR